MALGWFGDGERSTHTLSLIPAVACIPLAYWAASSLFGRVAGWACALLNLAWAPGQTIGAAGAGALAHETGDTVPYLALSAVCALTLAGLWRARYSRSSMGRSETASSNSSSGTTGAG